MKEVQATIEYAQGGDLVKSLLVSNDPEYVRHFSSIFEELWKNSLIM
jgi:two-component system, OmpR family, sensor histidine kinase VicK